MAKIISQIHLFDYQEIEILGDLERFSLALSGIDDEALMLKLEAKRANGRDDYPVRVMWNLLVALIVFGHKNVESFRRELNRNSQLRKMCGLGDFEKKKHLVPPCRVFSGFIKSLCAHADEIAEIFNVQVEELYEMIPGFGEKLAGDGKYIDSFACREPSKDGADTDLRTENDAKWSVKEYHYEDKNGKKQVKKEYHFGFKAHIICDVPTELPVAFSVTAANGDEKKEMIKLLGCPVLSSGLGRGAAEYLLLDRGYDSTEMVKAVKGAGAIPVIDIRNCWKDGEETKQYKETDVVYDYRGNVYCYDGKGERQKMRYEGYDRQKKCLRYSYKGKTQKIYVSYDERVFLPIARDSKKFKRIYKGRTSVERLNGRLDRDYMFEEHCIRGLSKMSLMVSLSMIIMNGMAIGKLKSGKEKIRSLKNAA